MSYRILGYTLEAVVFAVGLAAMALALWGWVGPIFDQAARLLGGL